jgi:hypothetical protein
MQHVGESNARNLPSMTGNGNHTTYKNDDLGVVYGIVLTT